MKKLYLILFLLIISMTCGKAQTWTKIFDVSKDDKIIRKIQPYSDGKIIAVAVKFINDKSSQYNGAGVYYLLKSENYGSSFDTLNLIQPINKGDTLTISNSMLEINDFNTFTIYKNDLQIFKTTNSGQSWTNISSKTYSGKVNSAQSQSNKFVVAYNDDNLGYTIRYTGDNESKWYSQVYVEKPYPLYFKNSTFIQGEFYGMGVDGNKAMVIYSKDGVTNLFDVKIPINIFAGEMKFLDKNNALLFATELTGVNNDSLKPVLLSTYNRGDSWEKKKYNNVLDSVIVFDVNTGSGNFYLLSGFKLDELLLSKYPKSKNFACSSGDGLKTIEEIALPNEYGRLKGSVVISDSVYVFNFEKAIFKYNKKTLGVADNKCGNEIKVYPNPVEKSSQVNLKVCLENGEYVASVYTLLGEKLFESQIGVNTGYTTLNISELNCGIYRLVLSKEDKYYISSFVVK